MITKAQPMFRNAIVYFTPLGNAAKYCCSRIRQNSGIEGDTTEVWRLRLPSHRREHVISTASQRWPLRLIALTGLICVMSLACLAQEASERASINSSIGNDGTGTIIVEAHGKLPEPPVFYTASADATAQVERSGSANHSVDDQGDSGQCEDVELRIKWRGEVTDVQDDNLQSWSVRQQGSDRFLDFHVKEKVTELNAEIKIRSSKLELPATIDLTHLAPGESVGFDSMVSIQICPGSGGSGYGGNRICATGGGRSREPFSDGDRWADQAVLESGRCFASPVELVETTLQGDVHSQWQVDHFQLRSTAHVTEPNAEITILSGNAAISEVPSDDQLSVAACDRE